jgi:5-methylcytosine-specific restriction endonuclease McrA
VNTIFYTEKRHNVIKHMGDEVFQTKPLVKVLSTGYEPMYDTAWQDAIKDVYAGRLEVIETHPTIMIGTVGGSEPFPLKVRFKQGVFLGAIKVPPKTRKPNRKNIFERDKAKCQYCTKTLTFAKSTVDHVVPRSRGGKNTWSNLVLCCANCNTRKGSMTPSEAGMTLLRKEGYTSPR